MLYQGMKKIFIGDLNIINCDSLIRWENKLTLEDSKRESKRVWAKNLM